MAGANLAFGNAKQIWNQIRKVWGWNKTGKIDNQQEFFVQKAGAPVNNDADDDPGRVHVLLWDSTNGDVYICTVYTDSTTHTWVKATA